MKLKEFKYSDQDERRDYIREKKITKKVNFAIDYLLKHLPINKLKKDNSFNFDKLKFNEGKNYDWYFLNNKQTTILVRQYREHFTFFAKTETEGYKKPVSIFTISEDRNKMTDEESDSFCDNPFQGITKYLPGLVEKIESDKIHMLWNDLSFKVPKYTDVKIGTDGESVHSLDTVIFACDELFNMYLCTYAENDVVEQVKKYKVGDLFGGHYIITKVSTEFPKDYSEPYYHAIGLEFTNPNFPDSKADWSDVYSLARYYADQLDHESVALKKKVMKFIYNNHYNVMTDVLEGEVKPFMWMMIVSEYIDRMYKLYNDDSIELRDFNRCVDKRYRDFIEMSYQIGK